MIKSYEDLEVFQRAYKVSLEIHRLSQGLPKSEQYALADQLRRSSKSVCACIAEGFAKQEDSPNEYKRYLLIAVGSASETRLWLRYCYDLKHLKKERYEYLRDECRSIERMLRALHKSWQ